MLASEKIVFFCFVSFMFFKNVDFAQGIRSKWRVPLCAMFLKIHDFSCFLRIVVFRGSRAHFFRYWSVPGTSQIDPDPSKVVVLLKREHDSQQIMFFILNIEFQKNMMFHPCWTLKHHPILELYLLAKSCFC